MYIIMRRLAQALITILASSFLLAYTASAAGKPIKVGLLLTYVGPTASFGRYEGKGANLLIDQVNAAGGINGRHIQIVGYDTEGKPDRAATLYRRLAEEDKVVAVIGPDSIYVTLGMSQVPKQVKVMSVSGAGAYELVDPKDRSYLVSAWASHGYSNALVLAYFADKFKVKRIGIITTADTIGEITAKKYTSAAKLAGIEVAKVVSQPATDRDLLPSLRELADVKPPIEGLMIFGSGPFGEIALNQTELAGLAIPVGYSGGNVIPELIKDVSPEAGKRFFLATSPAAVFDTLPKDNPYYGEISKFVADYQAKYKEQPALPAAIGYDMAMTVVDALKHVGPDSIKIRDYIYNKQKNLLGVQGVHFNRSPGDGYGVDPAEDVIASVDNGKFVFKGYLAPSLEHLRITDSAIRNEMKKFKIIIPPSARR